MTDKKIDRLDKISLIIGNTGGQYAVSPEVNAAGVMQDYCKSMAEQDVVSLIDILHEASQSLKANDLTLCESMLMNQALALQAMFTNLARRATRQDSLKSMEALLRGSLKAQNQCRMTLETLGNIKNPPVIYAKQANIAQGHQQVNNGGSVPARAGKNTSCQNELLEADTHEQQRLDTGAQGQAGAADSAVATLATVNWPKNGGRQAKSKS